MAVKIDKKVQLVLVLFCICCHGSQIEQCPATLQGGISPEVQFAYFGQPINLTCSVSSTDGSTRVQPEDLYFLASKIRSDLPDRIIPGSPGTKVLSENKAEIFISDDSGVYNTTSHKARYIHYVCLYNHTKPCHLQQLYIEVDYKPKPVADGKCVVENWERMECSWDLGVVYRQLSTTNITVVYEFNATVEYSVTSETWSKCPKLVKGQIASCIFESNAGKDSLKLGQYFFILIINNTRTLHSVQKNTTINNEKLVKPAAVSNLRGVANSTFITLSWESDNIYRPKLYRIKYIYDRNEEWAGKNVTGVLGTAHQQYILDGLLQDTEYYITVCVIPLIDGTATGYWSDRKDISLRTLEDVPNDVPNFDPGFFSCLNQNCSSLQIYWQPIQEKDRNGKIQKYRITIMAEDGSMNSKVNITIITVDDATATHANLKVNNSLINKVQLSQSTSAGFPKKDDAFIILPPFTDRPPVPKNLLVEALNNTHVSMSWDAPPESNKYRRIITYTEVWCRGTVETGCQGIIQSRVLLASKGTESIITVSGSYSDYVYGISAEAESYTGRFISSGITWNRCTYDRYAVPKKPLIVQLLLEEKLEHSMHFKWTQYSCEEERMGIVQNYTIEYCQMMDNDMCLENTKNQIMVNSSTNNYQIDNLRKGVRYHVWVMAGFVGGYSQRGEGASYKLYNPDAAVISTGDTGGSSVAGILGGVIGGIIGVIAFIFIVCMLRRSCKKADESVRDIEIPKMPKSNGAVSSHLSQGDSHHAPAEGRPLLPPGSSSESHSGATRFTESTIVNYTISEDNPGGGAQIYRPTDNVKTSDGTLYGNIDSLHQNPSPGVSAQTKHVQENAKISEIAKSNVKSGENKNDSKTTAVGEIVNGPESIYIRENNMRNKGSAQPNLNPPMGGTANTNTSGCSSVGSIDHYASQSAGNDNSGMIDSYVKETRDSNIGPVNPNVNNIADNSATDVTSAGSIDPYVTQTADGSGTIIDSVGSVDPYVRQADYSGELPDSGRSGGGYVRQMPDNNGMTSDPIDPYVMQTADSSMGGLTSAGSVSPYVIQTANGDLQQADMPGLYVREIPNTEDTSIASERSVDPYVRGTGSDMDTSGARDV